MFPLLGYLLAVSLAISLITTPIAARLGRRWGVLDKPGPRKVHSEPMPLSGGWAIFFTLTVVLWSHILGAALLSQTTLVDRLPQFTRQFVEIAPLLAKKIALPYLGALAMFILGLLDDIYGISVRIRLAAQLITAIALTTLGIRPELSFLPHIIGAFVGIIWIIGITNAFNLLDGLDGLSAGIALIATISLSTIMILGNQPNVAFLLMVIGGSLLGFLRSNYYPSKLFLGSSGSLLIGYLMAISSTLVTFMTPENPNWIIPIFIPLFILAIPIYDTFSVILLRLLKGHSIAVGDQSHFHHRLLRLGFSHPQTVAFVCLIAFAIALSAIRLADSTPAQSSIILLQIASILMILIIAERVAARSRKEEQLRAPTHPATSTISKGTTDRSTDPPSVSSTCPPTPDPN